MEVLTDSPSAVAPLFQVKGVRTAPAGDGQGVGGEGEIVDGAEVSVDVERGVVGGGDEAAAGDGGDGAIGAGGGVDAEGAGEEVFDVAEGGGSADGGRWDVGGAFLPEKVSTSPVWNIGVPPESVTLVRRVAAVGGLMGSCCRRRC